MDVELRLHAEEGEFQSDSSSGESEGASPARLRSVVTRVEPRTEARLVACPVPECKGARVSPQTFRQHWRARHLRYGVQYLCPVASCHTARKRRTDMNRHFRAAHAQFGAGNNAESLVILNSVPRIAELLPNPTFVNPGGCRPPVVVQAQRVPAGALPFAKKWQATQALAQVAAQRLRGNSRLQDRPASADRPSIPAPPKETLTVTIGNDVQGWQGDDICRPMYGHATQGHILRATTPQPLESCRGSHQEEPAVVPAGVPTYREPLPTGHQEPSAAVVPESPHNPRVSAPLSSAPEESTLTKPGPEPQLSITAQLAKAQKRLRLEVDRERVARVAKETARGAVMRLQAEAHFQQREADQAIIRSLAAEVETLRSHVPQEPTIRMVQELQELDVSRGYFIVPDISGRNQVFALTKEDLIQLRLHQRTPCASQDAL